MRINILSRAALGVVILLPSLKASAQKVDIRPIPEQIAAAILPLPEDMRAEAGVIGFKTAGKSELLRPSKNGMTCLGNDPAGPNFHVACYANSMEPFMLRGRELREGGTGGPEVDSVRFREVKSGKLKMPAFPASLYQLNGPKGDFNPATGLAPNAKPTYVVYIPFATSQSTGLSTKGSAGRPWIMYPGTPKAHIMITGTM
ncbi:MAG: hypothetical protein ABJB74_22690 [Gemmatimonas sp.]